MTSQFDKILERAYRAGYAAADNGLDPDFATWRVLLAGPGFSLDDPEIKVGDTVEIVGSDSTSESYHGLYGRKGIAHFSVLGDNYFLVYDPHTGRYVGGRVSWLAKSLRKINR